jgi:hydroxymethylbilane synthase
LPNKEYTLGTRGSLLAITQSAQILDQLREISGAEFKVEKIKTQGDQIVDKPLWQLDGKDFFTKELDEQLLAGKIDFVVHSYKDLGSDRPDGIELASITQRDYPHDILLIRKEVLKEKPNYFVIGTSSPRRTVNLQEALKPFIPWQVDNIEIKNLRGNVNTRIEKLIEGNYDAIVLAFAGIERLAKNIENQPLLQQYFFNLDYMVLPLSDFPTAAAQGALAIEVGPKTPPELKEIIGKTRCERTAREVKWEKEKFRSFGGGCHLPMGICAQESATGLWTLAKGKATPDSTEYINENTTSFTTEIPAINQIEKLFVGLPEQDLSKTKISEDKKVELISDELYLKKPIEKKTEGKHIYATSKHVTHAVAGDSRETLWCAGTKTWLKLASEGHWVNGSSDQFGEEHLMNFFRSALLQLLHGGQFQKNMQVLTNEDAPIRFGKKLTCYSRHMQSPDDAAKASLVNCEHFYWTSFSQYEAYCNAVPEIVSKKHYCGLGKSAERFQEANIKVTKIRRWSDLI